MDISDIQSAGGLISDELIKRTGQWRGKDVEFYVRKLAYGDAARAFGGDHVSQVELIRLGLRLGPNGTQQLTYQQAYQLDTELAKLFSDAISEVNEMDDEVDASPKGSRQKKNSGSKSRKRSAAPRAKPSDE